jgi:hypothetical protein
LIRENSHALLLIIFINFHEIFIVSIIFFTLNACAGLAPKVAWYRNLQTDQNIFERRCILAIKQKDPLMTNIKLQNITTVLATGISPRAEGLATLQLQTVCGGHIIFSLAQTIYDMAVLED